jgi:3D-(3,5/4)-trihydroxycyclohexane-1,2-dione acylhydrolase (decyclizing)
LIIAGGGVHYSGATTALADFSTQHAIPVCETQAGKGALPWTHAYNVGAIGVTGTQAANELAEQADLIIAIGTRLQDFTTGSGLLIKKPDVPMLSINVARHDLSKRSSVSLRGDARRCLQELGSQTNTMSVDAKWSKLASDLRERWDSITDEVTTPTERALPSDAEVIGVVNRRFSENATVVCAAGGLPGELHKLWRASDDRCYHAEYGYSCMGYEIAGGLGVKMAAPDRDVIVMVGDGSYLMMNSEIATSVALGQKLIIVVLNNHGFACINRLQTSLGGRGYNNMWPTSYQDESATPDIDFAQHAAALGAHAEKVSGIADLDAALGRAQEADRTAVVVIDTDPVVSTEAGGTWWDVPVAQVSDNNDVSSALADYEEQQKRR